MDIYIVVDCGRVVGASARQQGAELIRANESQRLALDLVSSVYNSPARENYVRAAYERMHIENHNLQDCDD